MSSPHVVVVGGGPAGLSAATALRRHGVDQVTVVERERTAGGAPRHTDHLGFGLRDLRRVTTGPRYATRLVADATRAGAQLLTSTTVTSIDADDDPLRGQHRDGRSSLHVHLATPDGPTVLDTHAVVLATGVRERPRAARLVPGDRPAGVLTTGALQQFVALHHQAVGRRAVVVGAEHVSFSAVMTLRHAGCDVAAMVTLHERHQMYRPLALAAVGRHRIPILTGVDVAEVVGRQRVSHVMLTDGTRIECDTVVFTGDWVPDHELARRFGLPLVDDAAAPRVDPFWRTPSPGVFAIGNLVHPAETADVCALDGRHVVPAVLRWLAGDPWPTAVRPIEVAPPLTWATWSSRGLVARIGHHVHGRLEVRHDGHVLWTSRHRQWAPHRSITVAHDHVRRVAADDVAPLRVALVE